MLNRVIHGVVRRLERDGLLIAKAPGSEQSTGVKRPAVVAMLRFTPALYSDPTNLYSPYPVKSNKDSANCT